MSFIGILKDKGHVQEINGSDKELLREEKRASGLVEEEKAQKPEEVLRRAGFKIKLVTSTSFGTQIDFAKKYDEDDVKAALKGFNIKIKNKSVFIVD